ncbi:MAG: rod shape-determining protein MreC [Chloroflexota bacterium]
MQRLINFVIRFREYIVFSALFIMSLSLISMGDLHKIGGFRSAAIALVARAQEALGWAVNPGSLRSENRALRELNLQLSTELTRTRQALIENNRLRAMFDFAKSYPDPLMPAEVVGKNSVEMRNYATLDKGSRDGVSIGMPVRTDAGLVGVIIGATNRYSLVELLNNRNVKVSAKIQRTLADGIITWEGGQYLSLNNIPTSFDVKKGDVVISSEYSNRYPKEAPIGKIVSIRKTQGTLFYQIKVEPFANFATMEQVFIIKRLPDEERQRLIKLVEQKLLIRKSKKK